MAVPKKGKGIKLNESRGGAGASDLSVSLKRSVVSGRGMDTGRQSGERGLDPPGK